MIFQTEDWYEAGRGEQLRIYQCEDTQNGILTAVYEAGISGYGHKYIRIAPIREGETESFVLFAEYITVVTDPEHARIVLDKVQSGISRNAYEYVMYALASNDPEKANLVYQFVTYGFTIGRRVTDAMQIPCVKAIFALQRRVRNEAAWFREILRFQEVSVEPSVLLAVIEPDHRILTMIASHFADRLNPERFMIYDKGHCEVMIHVPEQPWYIRALTVQECAQLDVLLEQKEEYVILWKTFFDSICIQERRNDSLQTNMAPKKYRTHMTEFQPEQQ